MLPNLQELQQDFQNYLQVACTRINKMVVSSSVSAAERLDIYRYAYNARLYEVLKEDFAGLAQVIGEKKFSKLAYDYIQAHPSTARSLRGFGKSLTSFISEQKSYQAKGWIIELAQFEWMLNDAFDGQDLAAITLNDMASIKYEHWPSLQLILHSSCQFLDVRWNSIAIWQAIKCQQVVKPHLQSETWLIWRKKLEVQFRQLGEDEAYMLSAFQAGKNFGDICSGLCHWVADDQVAMHAATLLKKFILDGIFSKLGYQ